MSGKRPQPLATSAPAGGGYQFRSKTILTEARLRVEFGRKARYRMQAQPKWALQCLYIAHACIYIELYIEL